MPMGQHTPAAELEAVLLCPTLQKPDFAAAAEHTCHIADNMLECR